jgi:putative ABC transport system permease protein
MVMANYNPVKVLKGSFSRSQSGARLRRALVLIQFGMSAVLLMGIYVTFRQLVFLQNKDLGLATEQVLVVRLTDLPKDMNHYTAFERWKSVVHNQKNVKSVAVVSNYPGDFEERSQSYYPTTKPDNKSFLEYNFVSEDYFKTMNIPFLAGHTFNDDLSADTTGIIINEDAVYQLGFDNPEEALGQGVTFTMFDFKFEIIGVVKNFSTDLKSTPSNSSFHHRKFDFFLRYFVIKLSTNDLQTTMADLEQSWKEMFNDSPLDYFFLDDYFNTFYKSEMQFASVFGFFSIVGVVITCMGLFGLSMYNTNSRTKEIGIRKSLGSSSRGIIWLLSKEYLKLVLVAGVISIPVGAWLLNNWLKNYPQRIEFGADFILAPLALMILIAQFTVGYQTYKAAHSNPVTSLRNE